MTKKYALRCEPGYVLSGASQVKCRDGFWSGKIPICIGKRIFIWFYEEIEIINHFSDHLWPGPAAEFDQREARPGEGAEEGDVQVGNKIFMTNFIIIILGSPVTAATAWWASTESTAPGGAGTSTRRPCVQVRKK